MLNFWAFLFVWKTLSIQKIGLDIVLSEKIHKFQKKVHAFGNKFFLIIFVPKNFVLTIKILRAFGQQISDKIVLPNTCTAFSCESFETKKSA